MYSVPYEPFWPTVEQMRSSLDHVGVATFQIVFTRHIKPYLNDKYVLYSCDYMTICLDIHSKPKRQLYPVEVIISGRTIFTAHIKDFDKAINFSKRFIKERNLEIDHVKFM